MAGGRQVYTCRRQRALSLSLSHLSLPLSPSPFLPFSLSDSVSVSVSVSVSGKLTPAAGSVLHRGQRVAGILASSEQGCGSRRSSRSTCSAPPHGTVGCYAFAIASRNLWHPAGPAIPHARTRAREHTYNNKHEHTHTHTHTHTPITT